MRIQRKSAAPGGYQTIILGSKPLWGEGMQVRDWLYAPLTAECLEFLLEKGEEAMLITLLQIITLKLQTVRQRIRFANYWE